MVTLKSLSPVCCGRRHSSWLSPDDATNQIENFQIILVKNWMEKDERRSLSARLFLHPQSKSKWTYWFNACYTTKVNSSMVECSLLLHLFMFIFVESLSCLLDVVVVATISSSRRCNRIIHAIRARSYVPVPRKKSFTRVTKAKQSDAMKK